MQQFLGYSMNFLGYFSLFLGYFLPFVQRFPNISDSIGQMVAALRIGYEVVDGSRKTIGGK